MKKIILLLAVFAVLGFVGCDNGTTDNGNGGGAGGNNSEPTIIDDVLSPSKENPSIIFYSEKDNSVGIYFVKTSVEGRYTVYSEGLSITSSIGSILYDTGNTYIDVVGNVAYAEVTFIDENQLTLKALTNYKDQSRNWFELSTGTYSRN